MISGYLVYLYSGIDLFPVDWKMPGYTVTFDRNEIMSWGKAIKNAYQYDMGITEWFPLWYDQMVVWQKNLVMLNGILIVLLLFGIMIMAVRKRLREWVPVYLIALLGGCGFAARPCFGMGWHIFILYRHF